ncbi:MAG: DUF11 domain-containing protein [Chloroflexi bacterium]|nr:DUF11 domain-containing protein [Chloroflexota bacterium]
MTSVTTTITSRPNLSSSVKTPSAASIGPGQPLTYTIWLNNTGTENAVAARVTDVLPSGVEYAAGSASATSGSIGFVEASRTLTWTGAVNVGAPVTITYRVTVSAVLPEGP